MGSIADDNWKTLMSVDQEMQQRMESNKVRLSNMKAAKDKLAKNNLL